MTQPVYYFEKLFEEENMEAHRTPLFDQFSHDLNSKERKNFTNSKQPIFVIIY